MLISEIFQNKLCPNCSYDLKNDDFKICECYLSFYYYPNTNILFNNIEYIFFTLNSYKLVISYENNQFILMLPESRIIIQDQPFVNLYNNISNNLIFE